LIESNSKDMDQLWAVLDNKDIYALYFTRWYITDRD